MIFEDPLAGMQGSLLLLSRWSFALGFIGMAFGPPVSTRKADGALKCAEQSAPMCMYDVIYISPPGDT